eukprot:1152488-Pelagomonas_calceolata.AAC.7
MEGRPTQHWCVAICGMRGMQCSMHFLFCSLQRKGVNGGYEVARFQGKNNFAVQAETGAAGTGNIQRKCDEQTSEHPYK